MAKTKNEEKNVNFDKNKNGNPHRGHRSQAAHKKPNAPAKETAHATRPLPPKKPRSGGIDHLFADFLPPIALESEKKAPETKGAPVSNTSAKSTQKNAPKNKSGAVSGGKRKNGAQTKMQNQPKGKQNAPAAIASPAREVKEPPQAKAPVKAPTHKRKNEKKRETVLPTGKLDLRGCKLMAEEALGIQS